MLSFQHCKLSASKYYVLEKLIWASMRLWHFSSSVNSFFVLVGLDALFSAGPFVYFHTSCVRTAKALERLRGFAGSPEPSQVAYLISTIISWAGSYSVRLWADPHNFWSLLWLKFLNKYAIYFICSRLQYFRTIRYQTLQFCCVKLKHITLHLLQQPLWFKKISEIVLFE